MAHPQQAEFIKATLARLQEFRRANKVLEIGSLNVNGSVRSCIECNEYVGIDISEGRDVDFRCPGELIELPDAWADVVISTECLEHARNWKNIFANAVRICRPQGLLVFTFAGLYRPAHGTVDSFDPSSSPSTNEYYHNIDHEMLLGTVRVNEFFIRYSIEGAVHPGDTYFWGIRSDKKGDYQEFDTSSCLIDRLARAQAQLGQALSRLAQANTAIAKYEATDLPKQVY